MPRLCLWILRHLLQTNLLRGFFMIIWVILISDILSFTAGAFFDYYGSFGQFVPDKHGTVRDMHFLPLRRTLQVLTVGLFAFPTDSYDWHGCSSHVRRQPLGAPMTTSRLWPPQFQQGGMSSIYPVLSDAHFRHLTSTYVFTVFVPPMSRVHLGLRQQNAWRFSCTYSNWSSNSGHYLRDERRGALLPEWL